MRRISIVLLLILTFVTSPRAQTTTRTYLIVSVKRGPDKFISLGLDGKGQVVQIQMTATEYYELGATAGDHIPPGVSADDWHSRRVVAYGGIPDYAGKDHLDPGEICDEGDLYKLGMPTSTKGDAPTLTILKTDLTDPNDFTTTRATLDSRIVLLTPTTLEVRNP